jgi:hypothetical protein
MIDLIPHGRKPCSDDCVVVSSQPFGEFVGKRDGRGTASAQFVKRCVHVVHPRAVRMRFCSHF